MPQRLLLCFILIQFSAILGEHYKIDLTDEYLNFNLKHKFRDNY